MTTITDEYGDPIEVTSGRGMGLDRVYVKVTTGGRFADVSLTPKRARRLRRALKTAIREAEAQ